MLVLCLAALYKKALDLESSAQRGEQHIQHFKESDCLTQVYEELMDSCETYLLTHDTIQQKYFALRLSNCYRKMSNLDELPCEIRNSKKAVGSCIKALGYDKLGSQLQLFVSQMDKVHDTCVYLNLFQFQQKSFNASRDLLEKSVKTNDVLSDIVDKSNQIGDKLMNNENQLSHLYYFLKAEQKENVILSQKITQALNQLVDLTDESKQELGSSFKELLSQTKLHNENLNTISEIIKSLNKIGDESLGQQRKIAENTRNIFQLNQQQLDFQEELVNKTRLISGELDGFQQKINISFDVQKNFTQFLQQVIYSFNNTQFDTEKVLQKHLNKLEKLVLQQSTNQKIVPQLLSCVYFYGLVLGVLFVLSALHLLDVDYKLFIVISIIAEQGFAHIYDVAAKFIYFQIYGRIIGLRQMGYLLTNNMKDLLMNNWQEQFLFLKKGMHQTLKSTSELDQFFAIDNSYALIVFRGLTVLCLLVCQIFKVDRANQHRK